MDKKNVDIICISGKALLAWLQFEGGIIHAIRTEPDKWPPDEIQIVLEHPDLHETQEGYTLMRITPAYTKYAEIIDGREYSRIERIDPPKGR